MMKEIYFETIMLIERLHKLFFDVVKAELDRQKIKDINNIQCFILYNIGKNQMTVGEVSNRGYYLGSNVTYNLKKMVEFGYILQEPSAHDRRSIQVRLSDKGLALFERLDKIFTGQADNLKHNGITEEHLKDIRDIMMKLESFWRFNATHSIIY